MADGLTSLQALLWGTSTGGAAGSGETFLTMGADRVDTRTPPDTTRVWGLQLNQAKNLATAMSASFKGGTRLQVLPQNSNPFGSTEAGLYIDNSGNAKVSYNGTVTALGGGGSTTTLATAYANGLVQADATFALDATRLGLIVKDASSTVGALLTIQNNGATTNYLKISSNATQALKSGVTASGSAVGLLFDSVNAYVAGDKATSWASGGAEFISLKQSFTGIWDFVSANANIGLINSSGDGIRAQGANTVYIYGAGAPQVLVFANNGISPVPGGMYNGTTANPWSSIVGTTITSFAGTGTATGNCPITIYENTTVTPSVTTGETAGSTYSIPANTLSAVGQKLRISAGWTKAANANSTTYKLYFNGTAFINVASAVSGDSIFTDFEIVRTAAGYSWHNFTASGAGVTGGHGTSTATFTGAIDTHISVTGATTNGDLSTNYMRVEWWP